MYLSSWLPPAIYKCTNSNSCLEFTFRSLQSPVTGSWPSEWCNAANVILTNLCCDNAASNTAALHLLSAALLDSENLKVTIDKINGISEPIVVVLDSSHLIKLVRNTLGDHQLLFTEDGGQIKWRLICELEKLQSEEGLHLANKINKQHVQFSKKKMKVYVLGNTGPVKICSWCYRILWQGSSFGTVLWQWWYMRIM